MRRRKRVPLPTVDAGRTAFGLPRTNCSCGECVGYCKVLPGYLIPEDLVRMIPAGADPLAWAREHLRASPGALVGNRATGHRWRIPTLVPARAESGACIFLDEQDSCRIHADAPFGCAFFDHAAERPGLSAAGLRAVDEAQHDLESLYHRLWHALHEEGLVSPPPEEGRARLSQSSSQATPWWKRKKKKKKRH